MNYCITFREMSINTPHQDNGQRGYRMESGQDLINLKQCQPQQFPSDAWCLEASWEVANKQGGIYTVLRSKAGVSAREMGDRSVSNLASFMLLGSL